MQPRFFPIHIVLILSWILGGGCKTSQFQEPQKSDPAPAKDGGKISDESEGVPGYLVNPESIKVEQNGNQRRIKAPRGSVWSEEKLADLEISVWQVTRKNLNPLMKPIVSKTKASGEHLGSYPVLSDGSFVLEVSWDSPTNYLVMTVTKKSQKSFDFYPDSAGKFAQIYGTLTVETPVFRGLNVGFGELAEQLLLKKCLDLWQGKAPFTQKSPFKVISTTITVGSIGTPIKDLESTPGPALVLVKASVTTLSDTQYELMNPNGWYCLGPNVNVLSNLTIDLHPDAMLADSSLDISILSSGDSPQGIVVGGSTTINRRAPNE